MSGGVSAEVIRTLFTMSMIGTILSGLLFALKPVIKDRISKAFQYYIWLVVLAVFIVPFSVNIQLSGEQNIVTVRDAVQRYVITPEEEMDRLSAADTGAGQIVGTGMEQPAGTGAEGLDGQTVKVMQSPVSQGTMLLFFLWMIGAFVFLGVKLFGYFRFIVALKRQNVLFDAHEKCKIYKNPLASTPMLIGVLRPVIILPEREYDAGILEHILHHELTHLKRQDILVKWLAIFANAVHWFNPAVYFVRHEISRACELSCDEAVIRGLDMSRRQEYGDTLIAVVADSRYPAGLVSTTMCEEKKRLKERLGAIMKYSKKGRLAVVLSAALLVLICTGAVFAGASVERGNAARFDSETFLMRMEKGGYLSPEITGDLPDFRTEVMSEEMLFGKEATLYLWSKWNAEEGVFYHKIEVVLKDGSLSFYDYRNYLHTIPTLARPMSLDEGRALAMRFVKEFSPDASGLKWENKPDYFSLYDKGHVESWVADAEGVHYIVMVDLDRGNVIFWSAQEPAQDAEREQPPMEQEMKQMLVAQFFAERALEELKNSVGYVDEANMVRFVMPKALPEGYMLYVRAAGKAKIEDSATGAFRSFYTQDENGLLEPGKTYTYDVGIDALPDELIVACLLNGPSGSIDFWTLIGFDKNGKKEIKSTSNATSFGLISSGKMEDKELVEFADMMTNRLIADCMIESSQVRDDENAELAEPMDKIPLRDIFPAYEGTEELSEWMSIKSREMKNHVLSEIDGILQMFIVVDPRYNNGDIKLGLSVSCLVKDQGHFSYKKGNAEVIVEMIRSDMLNDKKVQITAEDILEITYVSYNEEGEILEQHSAGL